MTTIIIDHIWEITMATIIIVARCENGHEQEFTVYHQDMPEQQMTLYWDRFIKLSERAINTAPTGHGCMECGTKVAMEIK